MQSPTRLVLATLLSSMALWAPSAFADASFDNADLKGNYSWEDYDPDPVNGGVILGLFYADGRGSCTLARPDGTQVICAGYSVSANGAVGVQGGLTYLGGTTFVLNNNDEGADGWENARFNYQISAKLVKQRAPGSGFNNADLKGSYSWKGPGASNPFAAVFTADGAGNCALSDPSNVQAFSCTYTVQPSGALALTTSVGTSFMFVLNNRGAGAVGSAVGGRSEVTLTKQ